MLAFSAQSNGGGLAIYGTATLTSTNVYSNQGRVSAHLLSLHRPSSIAPGRWSTVQGKGIRWAHRCLVREHIAAFEIGYAAIIDEEPPAKLQRHRRRARSGAWRTGLQEFKMEIHQACNVFIHVGVGQRCRAGDEEPSAILHAESEHT